MKFEQLYNCSSIDDILIKEKINQIVVVILSEIKNYINKGKIHMSVKELTNIRLIIYMMQSYNFISKECDEIIFYLDSYLLINNKEIVNEVITSNKSYEIEIENRKAS
jgi:hypothetical protein